GAILAFLFLMQALTGGNGWAASLGLPSLLVSAAISYGVFRAYMHIKNKYYATAVLMAAIAALMLAVDWIIVWAGVKAEPNFSNWFSIPGCLIVALVLAAIGRLRQKPS
ncbi:hypothetical protein LJC60_10440, partial [Ruminococcaceae bacterium OttesenSCG-928-D13]|nr:hypothetical protein [Ruminococcaceae bacterium OttesenSCG-928-D13]